MPPGPVRPGQAAKKNVERPPGGETALHVLYGPAPAATGGAAPAPRVIAGRRLLLDADDAEGDQAPARRLAERLDPVGDVQFSVDVREMEIHRPLADEQIVGDLLARLTLDHQGQHL